MRHLTAVLAVLAMVLTACGGPSLPDGFSVRETDRYAVGLPDEWTVVDDVGLSYQVVDPDAEPPMTVRIVETADRVRDFDGRMAELREALLPTADDATIIDEQRVEVDGALSAVQLTSEATLQLAETGERLVVRRVARVAHRPDEHLISVEVQGPASSFDGELSEAVLRSLRVR